MKVKTLDTNLENYQIKHRKSVVSISSSDSLNEDDINEKFKKIVKKFRNEPTKLKKDTNYININTKKIEKENNIDNEINTKDDQEKKI